MASALYTVPQKEFYTAHYLAGEEITLSKEQCKVHRVNIDFKSGVGGRLMKVCALLKVLVKKTQQGQRCQSNA